jgi:hypothetical protein
VVAGAGLPWCQDPSFPRRRESKAFAFLDPRLRGDDVNNQYTG